MILKSLPFFAIGALLLWVGWNNWKHRDTEAIPWIEDKVLGAVKEEPRPRTNYDRVSRRVQAVLGFLFGLFFLLIAVGISLVGE